MAYVKKKAKFWAVKIEKHVTLTHSKGREISGW